MGTTKSPSGVNCWIRRQQCPCGERKCYIRFEEGKTEEASLSQAAVNTDVDVDPPYVGQTFETDDEAFDYYSNFARKNGFAIRRESSRSNQDLGFYARVLVCHRFGVVRHRKSGKPERQRERKTMVCGCEAKMYIVKEIIGVVPRWSVKKFNNVHNHELLKDDQVRLLPAYRKIPDVDRERILLLCKAGCSVRHIMKVLQLEKGGDPGQLPFLERDVRNFVQSCKEMDRENDVSELLNVCKIVKERDENFFYDFTVDENAKLDNIAWSYGDSARAYELFGDVVVFDATYREITYDRLLGVWFGVDNHGKTIFFGCVLLRDETSHSFAWALQTFLRFMQGRYPQTILTDIDLGLRDAITSVLPNTKHVFCIWHIVSKLSSWFSLPLGSRYEEFKSEFDRLYNMENKKDFECQWNQMVTRFGLGSNKHIALLFSHRAFWALPHIRGYFLARMTTTEYSKPIDAFLKGILSAQTCLESFFEQVGIVANFRNQAGEEDMEDIHLKTSMPIEEHASSILTPYAFNLLQNEIVLSMQCAAFETANGSYLVRHHKKMDGGHLVSWNPKDEKIYCSCKEFEVSGILCRHALRVLALKNYFQLPEKYLPIRWRRGSSLNQSNTNDWSQAFHSLTSNLFVESSITKERIDYVQRELISVLNHVRNMPASDVVALNLECPPIDVRVDGDANGSQCNPTMNPLQSETEGQPMEKRTKRF